MNVSERRTVATVTITEDENGYNFSTEFTQDVPWRRALTLMGWMIAGVHETAKRIAAAKGLTDDELASLLNGVDDSSRAAAKHATTDRAEGGEGR